MNCNEKEKNSICCDRYNIGTNANYVFDSIFFRKSSSFNSILSNFDLPTTICLIRSGLKVFSVSIKITDPFNPPYSLLN